MAHKRLLCATCGTALCNDVIALNLKLSGRAASRFFCADCLAARLDMPDSEPARLIAFFKENHCELFARDYLGRDAP